MSTHPEQTQYRTLLEHVLHNGSIKEDRTGTGTRSVFGTKMEFDVSYDAFPLFTGKRTWFRGILHELLWFISGNTNIKYLIDNDVHIWNEWADENGDLGPVYGAQWRSHPLSVRPDRGDWQLLSNHELEVVDQLYEVIEAIKINPDSRRLIVDAWNVGELHRMALPPCHYTYQFYSERGLDGTRELSIQVIQRSADMFLGVPFNIASYSLLLMMVAKVTDHIPKRLIWIGGDTHIYTNHIEQVNDYLSRDLHDFPSIAIGGEQHSIDDFRYEDFTLIDYNHSGRIKAPISV